MKAIRHCISVTLLFFLIFPLHGSAQDKNSPDYWDQKHYELYYTIHQDYEKPAHKSSLDEYIWWIRKKGKDRRAVQEAWDELNQLYLADPENQAFKKWMQKFFELHKYAVESGNNTVNGASMAHIRFDYAGYSPESLIELVRKVGRPIYSAAMEEEFDPYYPRGRSNCLVNCAIGLLESDPYGFSLYRDRELLHGYLDDEGFINLPDYDFNVECERRGAFVRNTEGEPDKELTYAFENAGEIMTECEWWGFAGERQDAEDLLVEYYKDALCKRPPHMTNMGHKFYRELAQEHNLKEAIDYNNGFYGVLYGKVEVEEEGVKKRAPGAQVVFESEDEKWETSADENGIYRFEKAILHKHCSPFHIYATYKGDRVDDEVKCTYEEPDPAAIMEKDLLIKSTAKFEWNCHINLEASWLLQCKYFAGGQIEVTNMQEQAMDMKFSVDQIIFQGMSPLASFGKVEGSGIYSFELDDSHETMRDDYHQVKRTYGDEMFSVSPEILSIMIQKNMTPDDGMSQEEKMKQLKEKMEADPMSAYQEILAMSKDNEEKEFNNIMITMHVLPPGLVNITTMTSTESDEGHEHVSKTLEMPVVKPLAFSMSGTLQNHKDGTANITASYDSLGYFPNGMPSSFGCPDVTVKIKCELMMLKKK